MWLPELESLGNVSSRTLDQEAEVQGAEVFPTSDNTIY